MKVFELRHLAKSGGQLARQVSVRDIEPKDPVFGVEGNAAPPRRIRLLVPVDGVGSIKKLPQILPVEFSGVDLWGPNLFLFVVRTVEGRYSIRLPSQKYQTAQNSSSARVSISLGATVLFMTKSCLSWRDSTNNVSPTSLDYCILKDNNQIKDLIRTNARNTPSSSRSQFLPPEIPSVACRPHRHD